MSTLEFFNHCLKATQDKYFEVLANPTRSRKYVNEYRKVMSDLDVALRYSEITEKEGEELKRKFKELDYIAYKERMKKAGM